MVVFHGTALLANCQWCHNQDQADQSRSHFSVQGVCSLGGRMGWPITESLAVQILLILLRCCVLILNRWVRLVCPERWSTKNVKLMFVKRKFLEGIALTSKKNKNKKCRFILWLFGKTELRLGQLVVVCLLPSSGLYVVWLYTSRSLGNWLANFFFNQLPVQFKSPHALRITNYFTVGQQRINTYSRNPSETFSETERVYAR